ncbi:MAG TPA: hypothetical protein VFC65_04390 [Prolixibacteraceae bacterium]|nr:hypothetical protein [Prolixibacteraceae bacterium]
MIKKEYRPNVGFFETFHQLTDESDNPDIGRYNGGRAPSGILHVLELTGTIKLEWEKNVFLEMKMNTNE